MKGNGYVEVVKTMRLATLICLLAAFVLNPVAAAQQPRVKRRPPTPVTSPKKIDPATATVTTEQTPKRVQVVRSAKSQAMSKAFVDGKLPEPLRPPAGDLDAQAEALAKSVSAGDTSSTAALYAAVLAAGFGVRDRAGTVTQTTERGQGLAFEEWEIAAVSQLYGEDYGLTLKHLGDAFALGVPELKDPPLAGALLEGIRNGAKSENPSVRFLARFIIELGRDSEHPYDMLQQNDTAKMRLDAVQTFLILKRLAGDLAAVTRRTGNTASGTTLRRDGIKGPRDMGPMSSLVGEETSDNGVSFVPSRMNPGWPFAKIPKGDQTPCVFGDVGGVILDYNAAVSSILFGWLSDRVKGELEKYNKAANVINAILTVMKFIGTYALLKTDVAIDNHPLVRTKTTTAGEKRMLTAKLDMESDKWQIVNCLRPSLNVVGLDFDLPGAGPVGGAGVEWQLIEGGDTRGWLGTLEDYGDIMSGKATWGNGIVYFEPVAGSDRSPAKQFTGADGVSRMGVVGVPQARDMSREKLDKVYKVAGVKVAIQFKSVKITDPAKLAETLGDLASNLIPFLTKDLVGGVVGTAAETLYRSHWYSSEPFYFVVTDWEPCTGQWKGTMTTTTTLEQHTVEKINAVTKKDDASYLFEGTINFESGRTSAVLTAKDDDSDVQTEPGWGRITWEQKRRAQYAGDVNAEAWTSQWSYSVSFEMPKFTGTYQSSGSCVRKNLKCEQPATVTEPWVFSGHYMNSITGNLDPKTPNEIHDTKTFGKPGDVQHKVTVNLRRCQ